MIFASLRVTVCGHDLTINLERSVDRRTMLEKAQQAVSSETPIDTDLLRILAREYVLTEKGGKKVSTCNISPLRSSPLFPQIPTQPLQRLFPTLLG